jgi:SAM-dependent methyltransferase
MRKVNPGTCVNRAFSKRELGQFDIVYSWGVLHHTGDLGKAMREAARHVAPKGIFVFALYRRTRLDSFWIAEKRWYSTASPTAQSCARALYRGALRLGLLATGRNYRTHRETYRSRRGMSLDHDIHDWLGGYPYESISAKEIETLMASLGFVPVKCIARKTGWGLLGSGCDEFVYRRVVAAL